MDLFKGKQSRARAAIARLDLSDYIQKAKESFSLHEKEVPKAENEYRHFLWLIWWNRQNGNRLPVVPTERADKIWHAHLLFNGSYNLFCTNLYGQIIEHKPGLTVGSEPFVDAVLHTRALHLQVGYDGFDQNYFEHVDHAYNSDGPTKKPRKKEGDSGGGCSGGGGVTNNSATADTGADGGSGCGGGCGGCGG